MVYESFPLLPQKGRKSKHFCLFNTLLWSFLGKSVKLGLIWSITHQAYDPGDKTHPFPMCCLRKWINLCPAIHFHALKMGETFHFFGMNWNEGCAAKGLKVVWVAKIRWTLKSNTLCRIHFYDSTYIDLSFLVKSEQCHNTKVVLLFWIFEQDWLIWHGVGRLQMRL